MYRFKLISLFLEKKLLKGAFKHQPVTPGHYQRRRSSVKLSESFNKSSQNTLLELEVDANSNLSKYHMKMASLTDKVWNLFRHQLMQKQSQKSFIGINFGWKSRINGTCPQSDLVTIMLLLCSWTLKHL